MHSLSIASQGELDFHDTSTCLDKIEIVLRRHSSLLAGGVFTPKSHSVAILFGALAEVGVLDSQTHGEH